ncbi:MAG: penicillin-binding protein activator [Ponticaulis sp.]|nr:penicillin-binding protein activator [Ponticaulis sp.]
MRLEAVLRQFRSVPSLLVVGIMLTACATAPARPPAPISTGQPRVEPEPTPEPVTPPDMPVIPDPEDIEEPMVNQPSGLELTPQFMAGRDIRRIAVLLPFSHSSSGVREQANGLLAAVEMALFDQAGEDVLLIVKDTAGDARKSASVTQEAIREGADVIVGPLFANNVKSVAGSARDAGIPVIAFSNDQGAAGGGAYLMSFPPEEEVARVVDYAILNGITRFAFIGPSSTYARRVETALRFEASRRGGIVIGAEFYPPNSDAPVDEAQRIARLIRSSLGNNAGKVAVMIPDDGVQLQAVAPLLPYYGNDLRRIQYIGTSIWNDPTIWRESVLNGAVFAMPDPRDSRSFRSAFERNYGRSPASLASLGYDAAALAISFLNDGVVTEDELQELDGFRGVNGLFRFRMNGTVERGLSVMAIRPNGPELIEDAPESFVLGGS